jgi:predicted acylesterase/phospholipase RssA
MLVMEDDDNNNEEKPPTTIKHIVLSGGGPIGYAMYGVLRESNKAGFWNLKNIKTIYGTSIGTIMGTIISLGYDWQEIDDFLIKRPWHNVFKIDFNSFLSSLQNNGIWNIKNFEHMFEPLFSGKDISIQATMKEFFDVTGIEIHCITSEINRPTIEEVDLSYKTHPHWRMIDAIYCSSCLPIAFQPFLDGTGLCFVDGYFCNNYPLESCLLSSAESKEEVFGICKERIGDKDYTRKNDSVIKEDTTLLAYVSYIFAKFTRQMMFKNKISLQNEIIMKEPENELTAWFQAFSSHEFREKEINSGITYWEEFLRCRSCQDKLV